MRYRSIMMLLGMLLIGVAFGFAAAIAIAHYHNGTNATETQIAMASSLPEIPTDNQEMADELTHVDSDVPFSRELFSEASVLTQKEDIVVSVNGAVRTPGVYRFKENSRVKDGVLAAHGTTSEADMTDINIAARLMDNTTLYIPFQTFKHQEKSTLTARRTPSASDMNPPRYTRSGWVNGAPVDVAGTLPATDPPRETADISVSSSPTPIPSKTNGIASDLINLNAATLSELETLPGIGPKTAEKIDAYRKLQPFRTVDELDEVSGIGPKKLEAIRALVTVE